MPPRAAAPRRTAPRQRAQHEARALFIDLETCCRGPVEFDLARCLEEVSNLYLGIDRALLNDCRQLVRARWSPRGDGTETTSFRTGRAPGEEFTHALPGMVPLADARRDVGTTGPSAAPRTSPNSGRSNRSRTPRPMLATAACAWSTLLQRRRSVLERRDSWTASCLGGLPKMSESASVPDPRSRASPYDAPTGSQGRVDRERRVPGSVFGAADRSQPHRSEAGCRRGCPRRAEAGARRIDRAQSVATRCVRTPSV